MTREIAKMIDHSLLHPTLTDADLKAGCLLARQYNVASVCIKPYAVRQAARWLAGSEIAVGTVVGFPHGGTSIALKAAETELSCRHGAQEIDMVVNIGKVLSEDWVYVKHELAAIHSIAKSHKAILKVIFENDFLVKDHLKVKLCQICSELKVDFVKTSTGFGMVKGADGKYDYQGATIEDIKLMRKYSSKEVRVKAAGGIRSLDKLLEMKSLGATRIGASATASMLDEAIARFGGEKPTPQTGSEIEGY